MANSQNTGILIKREIFPSMEFNQRNQKKAFFIFIDNQSIFKYRWETLPKKWVKQMERSKHENRSDTNTDYSFQLLCFFKLHTYTRVLIIDKSVIFENRIFKAQFYLQNLID